MTSIVSRAAITPSTTQSAKSAPDLRTRRALIVALLLSLAVHFAFTFWPEPVPEAADSVPLTATLTEMPPPPKPVAAATVKPEPRPKRAAPVATPEPAPTEIPVAASEVATADDSSNADAFTAANAPPVVASAPEIIPGAAVETPTLPPRVDLAYKVFYGTRGFLIGEAVYRFEHSGNSYRITTVGEARGLAALILRGQGKVQSRGLITAAGLQPLEFNVERGGPDRRESAVFDWEAGIVTMHDNKTADLDIPTYDPMTIMWQFYFTPPTQDVISFAVATPRRFARYTVTREESEPIEWSQGTLDTERWHRRSDDGKTDSFIWLAPKLHYVPVKIRVTNTDRGTVEALLDSIRIDEIKAE